MARIAIDELHDLADAIGLREARGGANVTPHLQISKDMARRVPGAHRNTHLYFATAEYMSVLRITGNDTPPPRAWISFAGAGASKLPASAALLQHLLVKGPKYEWGGPFVVPFEDGITFGMKYTIPSDLIGNDDESFDEATTFIWEMVVMMGRLARMLANDLVPSFGGHILQDVDADRGHFYSCL